MVKSEFFYLSRIKVSWLMIFIETEKKSGSEGRKFGINTYVRLYEMVKEIVLLKGEGKCIFAKLQYSNSSSASSK